jgi:hypothetical protein
MLNSLGLTFIQEIVSVKVRPDDQFSSCKLVPSWVLSLAFGLENIVSQTQLRDPTKQKPDNNILPQPQQQNYWPFVGLSGNKFVSSA